jgi:hypothetical protein
MSTETTNENAQQFECLNCDFKCSKQSDWNRHILRPKHLDRTKLNILEHKKNQFICKHCNKIYKARNSLWYHEKKCKDIKSENDNINIINENKELTIETEDKQLIELLIKETSDFKNVVLELVKSNNIIQNQMLEVCKTSSSHINSHNTINSHNKNFNLNFFLNEQCKDAMNIMDFVNTFQLSLSDFERIGEVGYVEGISTIVMDKLNQMDVYKRPIHCSDAKRETMHVKDNGVWSKDSPTNDKIRLALKHITKKNTDLIRPWLNAHPGVLNSEHRLNDKYQEMFIEAMGGRKNKNIKEGEDKIITLSHI